MSDIEEIIRQRFCKQKIVIVGDVVADQFLQGTIARVSREAPVFILSHDETDTRPGGAANAAVNVARLGAQPLLIGVTGDDSNGKLLSGSLKAAGVSTDGLIADATSTTTTKVRVLAGQHYAARQQVIRIDYENKAGYPANILEELKNKVAAAAEGADAIIFSDYGYGVATSELYREALQIAKKARYSDTGRFALQAQ